MIDDGSVTTHTFTFASNHTYTLAYTFGTHVSVYSFGVAHLCAHHKNESQKINGIL